MIFDNEKITVVLLIRKAQLEHCKNETVDQNILQPFVIALLSSPTTSKLGIYCFSVKINNNQVFIRNPSFLKYLVTRFEQITSVHYQAISPTKYQNL